jgi:hypothetical protein
VTSDDGVTFHRHRPRRGRETGLAIHALDGAQVGGLPDAYRARTMIIGPEQLRQPPDQPGELSSSLLSFIKAIDFCK